MQLQFPKVSVVVSTYNRPEMLVEAVQAIFSQTYRDFELVVADDGSFTAKEALEPFAKKFDDAGIALRVLELKENSGFQSVPNNVAFQYCTGSYIAQADDDDIWDEDHLETLVNAIEESGADLVYSRFRILNTDESRGGPPNGSEFPFVPFNYLTVRLLLSHPTNNFINSHTLWSKGAIFAALGSKPWNEEVRKFGDWDFFVRAVQAGADVHGVDKITLTYRWGHPQIQVDRQYYEGTSLVVSQKPPKWDKDKVLQT